MATATCIFTFEVATSRRYSYPAHSHPCTEIVIYTQCEGTLVQGTNRLKYRDGSLAIYQPPLKHYDQCEKPGKQLCVGVTGCGAEKLRSGMYKTNKEILNVAALLRIQLKQNHPLRQTKIDLLSGWLVTELFELLTPLEKHVVPATSHSIHVQAAKKIFDTRLGETLSIQSVAQELFIHHDYLRQLFCQQIGETPIHYLLRRRVECACGLLKKTDLSIKKIAEMVGLENPYYFSRFFKKWTGKAPSEYRGKSVSG